MPVWPVLLVQVLHQQDGWALQPTRIVSLISSGTEILYQLGLGDRVIAVSHECDHPPDVNNKPRVTFTRVDDSKTSQAIDDQVHQLAAAGAPMYEIDHQQIARLAPELIVTQAQCDVCAVRYADVIEMVQTNESLLNADVVSLNPTSLDDIFADIAKVGEATGAQGEAQQLVARLRERVNNIHQVTVDLPTEMRPRVVCIEWIQPLMLAANWVPNLVELAGGENGLTEGQQHSAYGDWESVIQYDPEVIVVSPCGFDLARTIEEAQVLIQQTSWTELAAVRNNRVFAVDGNAYFNRSGPRIIDTLEILALLFHRQRFDIPRSLAALQQAYCRLQTNGDALTPVSAP